MMEIQVLVLKQNYPYYIIHNMTIVKKTSSLNKKCVQMNIIIALNELIWVLNFRNIELGSR